MQTAGIAGPDAAQITWSDFSSQIPKTHVSYNLRGLCYEKATFCKDFTGPTTKNVQNIIHISIKS